MNIVEIPVRRIVLRYPSEWEELTRRQALRAGKYLLFLQQGRIDADQFRKLMVDFFIRRVNNMARGLTADQEMDLWGNEWVLAETVNFFFDIKKNEETGQEVFEIVPKFSKNLVPWFRVGLRRVYGPGDFLQGMVFAEFKDALAMAGKYIETGDEAFLDRLTAIMYRRRRRFLWLRKRLGWWDGRERVMYNPALVDGRRMKRAPKGAKFMCFLYLMGCLHTLRTDGDGVGIEIDGVKCAFSLLFRRPKTDDRGPKQDDGVGMMGVLMAMAESGVFGNIHETARADVWDVLVRMYQLELQRREMEKQVKR